MNALFKPSYGNTSGVVAVGVAPNNVVHDCDGVPVVAKDVAFVIPVVVCVLLYGSHEITVPPAVDNACAAVPSDSAASTVDPALTKATRAEFCNPLFRLKQRGQSAEL